MYRLSVETALAAVLATTSILPGLATARSTGRNVYARNTIISYEPISPSLFEDLEIRSFRAASRASKRAMGWGNTTDVDRLFELRDCESFYWGTGGNPQANLTTYADGNEVKILSLERFSDVLNTAECSSNSIDLTFTKEVQFDEIQQAWSWVNDASQNYIVFVTESAQCNVDDGDDDARQPWHVTSATFNDDTNIVTLHAEPRTWAQAFSNWHLRVSNTGILPPEQQRRLLARHDVEKRVSLDFTKSIPIAQSFTGSTLEAGFFTLTCSDCKTEGALNFDVDITPKVLTIHPGLDGYVKFGAEGVGLTMELDFEIAGGSGAKPLELESPSIPLPYSIEIPHVMTLGSQLKFGISGSAGETESKASITTGLKLDFPDNAMYYHNLDDSSQDQMADWTPEITPMKPKLDIGSGFSASFAPDVKVFLEGSALGLSVEVGVSLAVPKFNIQAETSKECGKKKNQAGIEVDVGVGLTVDAYQVAKAEFLGQTRKAEAKEPIYSLTKPFLSTCLATPTARRLA